MPVLTLHQKPFHESNAVLFVLHAVVADVCIYVYAEYHTGGLSIHAAAFLFEHSWIMLAQTCLPKTSVSPGDN